MRRALITLVPALYLSGCSGRHSALDPAGLYAEEISSLWWLFFAVCMAVYCSVLVALVIGLARRRGATSEKKMTAVVVTAVAATVVILFALLIASTGTGHALSTTPREPAVQIVVTAQQWWWDVVYDSPDPSKRFTTANEIVVPVGIPVRLILESRDVIHSLWIPNIHGKRDLIPGQTSELVIQADRAGDFEGQCAEFCGLQHAHMRIVFRALPPDEFARWTAAQHQPARVPDTPEELAGQRVFMSRGCPLCHTISGTDARARTAPDLTHLASRSMIAAGSRPNTPGHLAAWVVDSQSIKPGNRMPPNLLRADELNALLTYLRSLE